MGESASHGGCKRLSALLRCRGDIMARTKQLGESRFVNVRMPLPMIERLESLAKKAHKNRSTVVRELLVEALGDE